MSGCSPASQTAADASGASGLLSSSVFPVHLIRRQEPGKYQNVRRMVFWGIFPQMTMRHANWLLPHTLQGPVGVPPLMILRGGATSRFFVGFHNFLECVNKRDFFSQRSRKKVRLF